MKLARVFRALGLLSFSFFLSHAYAVDFDPQATRRIGLGQKVQSCDLTLDGTLLVTGGEDHKARVWDIKTGSLLTSFFGYQASIIAIKFSPDHSLVLGAESGGVAIAWDTQTGRELAQYNTGIGEIKEISFSSDGTKVGFTSKGFKAGVTLSGKAKLYEVHSGKLLKNFETPEPFDSAAFAPDTNTLATGSFDGEIKLWDVNSGSLLKTFRKFEAGIHSLAFTADNSKIFANTEYNEDKHRVKVIDISTGQITSVEYWGDLDHIKISPDGRQFIALDDGLFFTEDLEGKTVLAPIYDGWRLNDAQYSTLVVGAFFASDNQVIEVRTGISGARGPIAIGWHQSGGGGWILLNQGDNESYAVFGNSGREILAANYDSALLLDTGSEKVLKQFHVPEGDAIFQTVAFSPDESMVAASVVGYTNSMTPAKSGFYFWNKATGEFIKFLPQASLTFSPDGSSLLNGNRLLKFSDGSLLQEFPAKDTEILSLFSPAGSQVLLGENTPTLREVKTGKVLHTFERRDPSVSPAVNCGTPTFLAISKNGNYAALPACWAYGSGLAIADLKTGKVRHVFDPQTSGIREISLPEFSPHSDELAFVVEYSGPGRELVLLDVASLKIKTRFGMAPHDFVSSLHYSPDSSKLLTTGGGDLKLTSTHQLSATVVQPTVEINGQKADRFYLSQIKFIPHTSKLIATGSYWLPNANSSTDFFDSVDFDVGKPIEFSPSISHNDISILAVSKDGKELLTSDLFSKYVRLWTDEGHGFTLSAGADLSYLAGNPVAAFLEGTQFIFVENNGHVEEVPKATAEPVQLPLSEPGARVIAISSDGLKAVSVDEASAHLWDLTSGKEIRKFDSSLVSATFSPDNSQLIVGTLEGKLRLFNLSDQSESASFQLSARASNLVFSPDGNLLLSCDEDFNTLLFNAKSLAPLTFLNGLQKTANQPAFAFSNDSREVVGTLPALGLEKGDRILVWDVPN